MIVDTLAANRGRHPHVAAPPFAPSAASPRWRRAVCVALIALFTGVLGWPAAADSIEDKKREADRDAARLQQALRDTGAELAASYLALKGTEARLTQAQEQLTRAQQALDVSTEAARSALAVKEHALDAERQAKARYEADAQRLAEAATRQQRATEQRSLDAARLAATQDALDAYAAEVFQSGQPSPQLSLMLGMSSLQTVSERTALADIASQIGADAIDRVSAAVSEGRATQAYLSAVAREVRALRDESRRSWNAAQAATRTAASAATQAESAKQNAATARGNAAAARAFLVGLRSTQTRQTQELAARKAQEERQLAAKQADARRLQAVLTERARIARQAEQRQPSIPPVTASGRLAGPVAGEVTSPYGMRWHPVLQKWMLHDGLDIAAACGTPVYAAADGQVIRAGWNSSGWGNQVLVDHGIRRGVDLVTSYNHLSRIARFSGPVRRGQLIGSVGTTGFSTGCHLHFGAYEDGRPVNPRAWLG
ncbi:peptidoglycan DD-metalloendopeptidase family protein [Intrasporangium chromatireducens]|nr:M23 family metallopeptidase [Intrasporangium chromatireducens]